MTRKIKLSKLSILVILLMLSGSAFSQVGPKGRMMQGNQGRMGMQQGQHPMAAMLDLSDKQKEEMIALRTAHQKEMQLNQNLLNEKRAHLRTLMSASDLDNKAINKTIDEMASMKAKAMKKRIANHQEMKSILTPEQLKKAEAFGPRFAQRGQRGFAPGQGFARAQRGQRGQRGAVMGRRGNQRGQRGQGMGPCGAGMRNGQGMGFGR